MGAPFPGAPLSALDFLLAVDDTSRLGALRFQDEHGDLCRATEPGRRTTPPLVELGRLVSAAQAIETNTEAAADLAYLRGRGNSLGGLRPKRGVIDDGGHLSIAIFPSVTDERPVTKGEVLAMKLASRAGVRAAEAEPVHRRRPAGGADRPLRPRERSTHPLRVGGDDARRGSEGSRRARLHRARGGAASGGR